MFALCIESSHARGLGHLYRSLNLASAMRARKMPVRFLINDHPASVALIREHGHDVDIVDLAGGEQAWLNAHGDVRVWINDRLNTDGEHALRIKAKGLKLVTFDDRGGGAALADLHIAALAFADVEQLRGQQVLHGVDYLLLDPMLGQLRRLRTTPASLLVTMGGSDTWGVTPRVMQALLARGRGATIVLGPAFCHRAAVDGVLAQAPVGLFTVHHGGVPSLADEMAHHDLAITGGGMTPFEANAMGLPCIVIANETFEVPTGKALERLGGAIFVGFHAELDLSVLDHPLPLSAMSQAGMDAIDLRGCERILNAIMVLGEGKE